MIEARAWRWCAVLILTCLAAPVAAMPASPRELLVQASFVDRDREPAIRRVNAALAIAEATLRASPSDGEAALVRAMATSYHAKLSGSRTEALAGRKLIEDLIAHDPRNAEAALALGAWHVGAVYRLGGLAGRMVLGARKQTGLAALDHAVALGSGRPLFSAVDALLRLELDPADQRGRALAEEAIRADALTPLDRILQHAAALILASLRAGDQARTQALAAELLPFGRLPH